MEKSIEEILCMGGGDGEDSYATHSIHQREVMKRGKEIVEETLTKVYEETNSPKSLNVADLGCASGPNPLLFIREVMDTIGKICDERKYEMPEVQVFLNDLPSTDFNETFKSIPDLYVQLAKENKKCFVGAMPGSFYGRLFPSQSLHFVHSSYALQWLSQAPRGLINENGEPLHKGNICLAESSGPLVHKLYYEQFERDFHLFLKSRSEEIVRGGGMALTMPSNIGGKHKDSPVEVIGLVLYDLANEGLLEKSKVDMFDLPVYPPSVEEIKRVVQLEGSFEVSKFESYDTPWDAFMPKDTEEDVTDITRKAEFITNIMRAGMKPLLAAYFGEDIMDEVFRRLQDKYVENMIHMECNFHNVVVSLRKI